MVQLSGKDVTTDSAKLISDILNQSTRRISFNIQDVKPGKLLLLYTEQNTDQFTFKIKIYNKKNFFF